MISLLAIMAVPAMRTARDDRMAFDYARQFQAIIHRAEIRAMSRGAAHLVLLDRSGATRGRATLFEAVDATPVITGGPKPVSSCRGQRDATNGTFVNHWIGAEGWTPGGASPALSPLVDNTNVDGPGVEAKMNLFITLSEQGTVVPVIAICYTPGGNVYVGTGSSPTAAVAAMRTARPYNSYFEVEVARHDASNNVLGLRRRIFVAGGAAPRIVSQ